MYKLTIATRRSPLARWQADFVADTLRALHPQLEVDILPLQTKGDQWQKTALSNLGGKGLFVKELETALLNGDADIAVHSMKDVPAHFPDGLGLAAILKRHDPRDALLGCDSISALPQGACVGTASQRRALQLVNQRPDLSIKLLRGNIQTRMRKLDEGEYDAILLAASGLQRMGYDARIQRILNPDEMLPAIGQGALGIEARLNDEATLNYVKPMADSLTTIQLEAERAVGQCMGSSCQTPVAAYAEIHNAQIHLRALMGDPNTGDILSEQAEAPVGQALALGKQLGDALLAKGGQAILERLQNAPSQQ